MEPNKFEEHIRTQLQERELQPSKDAWATLEAQLGDAKGTNRTLWYAIAASFIAMLVIGSFLLKDDATVSTEIVIETPEVEAESNTELTISEEKENDQNENNQNAAEILPVIEKIIPKKTQNTAQIATTKKRQKKDKQRNDLLAAETTNVQKEKEPIIIKDITKRDFVDVKVDEVVAQVLNSNKTNVSAEDIENLLQAAQKDIATQRILNQATTKVDPASLLNDVESELERGFRDKVFDALGEGFNKVRTAVGERNN